MKFIALKSFRNVPSLGVKLHDDANKNNHIDKGETLEIGDGKDFKTCNNHYKAIIGQLVYAGCIGDASDKKVVEAVEAELKIEAAREAAAKKLAAASSDSALVQSILAKLRETPAAPEGKPAKT